MQSRAEAEVRGAGLRRDARQRFLRGWIRVVGELGASRTEKKLSLLKERNFNNFDDDSIQ